MNFDELFLTIRSSLARSVAQILPPHEIEDVVQEAYLRVCKMDRSKEIKYAKSYMFSTVKNLAVDHIRRSEYRLTDSLETAELGLGDDVTFHHTASNEKFAHFCGAVSKLPLQCRRVFILKKVYGYTLKEIARTLEISESTVEKHITLALKKCARSMEGYLSEIPNN